MESVLYTPKAFAKLTEDQLRLLIGEGGCGAGEFGDYLVPDTLLGLDIKPCCQRHDYMYSVGVYAEDKKLADMAFLNNMTRAILEAGGEYEQIFARLKMAKLYYNFVKWFGDEAFWGEKFEQAKDHDKWLREHIDEGVMV